MAICVLFTPAANTLLSLHIRRQSLDNVIKLKISCAGSKGSWEYARLHRLAWAFYTVSKYHVLVEMAIYTTFVWAVSAVVGLRRHHGDSVQPSVRCISASRGAPSALW